MTNAQLLARIASLHTHQMHIESLERLLQNAVDYAIAHNHDTKSSHRLHIESCLRVERITQEQHLNAFRNEMKA